MESTFILGQGQLTIYRYIACKGNRKIAVINNVLPDEIEQVACKRIRSYLKHSRSAFVHGAHVKFSYKYIR